MKKRRTAMNRKPFLVIGLIVILSFSMIGCSGEAKTESGDTAGVQSEDSNTGDAQTTTDSAMTADQSEQLPDNITGDEYAPIPPQTTIEALAAQNPEIADKLDKIKEVEKSEDAKAFMLCVAQDDLESYVWGGNSLFSEQWQSALAVFNNDGSSLMQALSRDLDVYLSYGTSNFEKVWAYADLCQTMYESGDLKTQLGDQYDVFIGRLNAVQKRLGVIYASPEYISQ